MDVETDQSARATDGERLKLRGDPAKRSLAEDAFGLENIAKSLAALLASRVAADGYAIGIEGPWGSGKTSLTNFVLENLEQWESLTLKVLRFEPWLVGSREGLLGDFFRGLRAKIEEFRDDPRLASKLKEEDRAALGKLVPALELYQGLLEGADTVASAVVVADPSLYGKIAGGILKVLVWVTKWLAARFRAKPQTLESVRDRIRDHLRVLDKLEINARFLVVIDDVDRLEPAESIEILRVVRAIADFPLVTYLVCFDRPHLAKQIRRVVGVGNGHDYLEKVFQNIVSVPPQEAFALRRYARTLLAERFPEEFERDAATGPGQAEREATLFDRWAGELVKTPRDAVRFAEAVAFGWPDIRGKADFFDYAWLQLIKLQCHDLYEWTREYVVVLGAYRDGGRPGDQEPAAKALKLRAILEGLQWSVVRDQAGIGEFLPGVAEYVSTEKPRVLTMQDGELAKFETGCRLGSPSHWRLYFAGAIPSYALEDDVLIRFRKAAARDVAAGAEIIRTLVKRPHARRAYYLGVMLDRLFDTKETLTDAEKIGIAAIFSLVMDEVPAGKGLYYEGIGPWRRAETLLGRAAAPGFAKLCAEAPALNWLTDVIRTQGFAHGRPEHSGGREAPLLDTNQFEEALSAILGRLYNAGIPGILKMPLPVTPLYCWLQLGDIDKLSIAIAEYVASDEGLIALLQGLRTWVSSSRRGEFHSLQMRNVDSFLDGKSAYARVKALSESSSDTPLRNAALELLDVWDLDR